MGKTTEKLITFYLINNEDIFDVKFVEGAICLGNRNLDATNIWIEISEEDWDEIVEFIKQQKGENG